MNCVLLLIRVDCLVHHAADNIFYISEPIDEDFVPLAPKPGAHLVLPFIPPKFPSLKVRLTSTHTLSTLFRIILHNAVKLILCS
jgi:hypothetical protein